MSIEVVDLDYVKQTYFSSYQIWGYNIYDLFADIVVDWRNLGNSKRFLLFLQWV